MANFDKDDAPYVEDLIQQAYNRGFMEGYEKGRQRLVKQVTKFIEWINEDDPEKTELMVLKHEGDPHA